MLVMNLEARKINIINWISSLQEEDVLSRMEAIQREKGDWWDALNEEDKAAVNEGLEQLDRGAYLTREQVRERIKNKVKL